MDRTIVDSVRRRADFRCEYCQMPQQFDPLPFQMDHIIARKHGDDDGLENLALACFSCNNHKGSNIAGLDRESNAILRLFNPRQDVWSARFLWRGPELIGRTAIGRVTIYILGINLRFRRKLRRQLIAEGAFPPR